MEKRIGSHSSKEAVGLEKEKQEEEEEEKEEKKEKEKRRRIMNIWADIMFMN